MLTLLTKVWFDLWQDKTRTLQVVMVIALGAIGVGLVIGGRNLVAGTVSESWQAAQPPHIKLSVSPPLTREQLESLGVSKAWPKLKGCKPRDRMALRWRMKSGKQLCSTRREITPSKYDPRRSGERRMARTQHDWRRHLGGRSRRI